MIKSTTRFIALAALFLIPIFPLIVANHLFFPYITGKAFYFRILIEIAFASWVVLACIDAKFRPRINAISIGVTVFALVALVADLLGVHPIRSIWSNYERMEGWVTVAHLWMLYITMSGIFGSVVGNGVNKNWWHRWFNVFLGVGLVVAGYGALQLLGKADIHQGSVRIDASLGNAAYMAVYMLMNAGIAAYMFFVAKFRRIAGASILTWVYGIGFLIYSFMLFETATRGTILGLIGGIMLSLVLYAIFAKNESKRSRYISGGIVVFIVLLGLVFWANRGAGFIQKNEVLKRLATISWNETQSQARAYIWPMAVKGFTERPVLGWGQENFNFVFNANYNPKMWTQEQWFDRAHNVFLDWLIAAGLVGFLAYISLYVLALLIVWKSDLHISEKSVITGLIAAYAVHNVFVFDNLASYVGFFALLAFIGSALSLHNVEHSKKSKKLYVAGRPLGGEKVLSSDLVEYVVLPLAIICLVLGLYFVNIRPIRANGLLITALQNCANGQASPTDWKNISDTGVYLGMQEVREQSISCATGNISNTQAAVQTRQDFLTLAEASVAAQIADAPKDARIYVLGGAFYNGLAQQLGMPQFYAKGQELLEKAHALTPGKQVVSFELANDYIFSGKVEKSLALLKKAYEDDPTYPAAKQAYGLGLLMVNKETEARALLADNPGIFDSEQVAQIYANTGQAEKAVAIYAKLYKGNTKNVDMAVKYAKVQLLAGRTQAAIVTLRQIAIDNPDYKTQVEATIKQIQANQK